MATVVRRRFQLRGRSWCGTAALVVALAGAAPRARATDPAVHYPLIGQPAPELVERLFTGGGRNFRLSERRGEVVVIGFWTSWCGSCRKYLERLAKLDATYAQTGLVVLGISLDDDPARAQELAHAIGATFRNGVDAGKTIGHRYGVPDVPLTLLIDRGGVVRYAHGELDAAGDASLVTELRELLDE